MDGLPDPEQQIEFYDSIIIKRAVAWIVDCFITFFIAVLVSIMSLGIAFIVFFGVWFLVIFLYYLFTLTSKSSTYGMRLMSIEMRKNNGMEFDDVTAFIHTAATCFCFLIFILQIVSVLSILFSPRSQSLPDLLLSTTALNKRAKN